MEVKLGQENFKFLIKMINSICTKQIDTNDSLSVYYMLLKDKTYDELLEAITYLAKTKENTFSPFSPAEILKAIDRTDDQRLTIFAEDIFNQIKLDIIKYPPEKRPSYIKPVNDALEYIGGIKEIGQATDEDLRFIKNRFKKEIIESPYKDEIKEVLNLEYKNTSEIIQIEYNH